MQVGVVLCRASRSICLSEQINVFWQWLLPVCVPTCPPASTGGANQLHNSDMTVRRSYGKLTVRDPLKGNADVTQFTAHMYTLTVPGTTKRSGTVRIYHVRNKQKPLPQRSNAAAEMNANTARLRVLFDNLKHPHISVSSKQLLESQITKLLEDGVSHVLDKQGSGEDGVGIHDAQEQTVEDKRQTKTVMAVPVKVLAAALVDNGKQAGRNQIQ